MKDLILEIEGQAVDFGPETELALNYSVHDIRNLAERDGVFSEEIILPFTNHNDLVFGNIRQGNSASDMPYILAQGRLLHKYNLLLKVSVAFTEMQDGYHLTLTGQNADLFAKVKDLPLSDIDLSDLDHAWTNANVAAARTHNPDRGYIYPLIDYGKWFMRLYEPGNMRFDELYPAVYVRTLLERIAAPYTLTGSFMESEVLDKLVIPFSNKNFIYRESYRQGFKAKAMSTQDITYTPGSAQSVQFIQEIYDPANCLSSNFFLAPIRGDYRIKTTLTVNTTITSAEGVTVVFIRIHTADGADIVSGQRIELQSGLHNVSFETNIPNLGPGDAVSVYFYPAISSHDNKVMAGATLEVELLSAVYADGQVQLDANLPDMTQDAFLLNIFTLFNVVIQTNSVLKTVRLDFQSDFLTNEPVDWSHKIDWNVKPKTVFALENYAQSNYIGYKAPENKDLNPDKFNLTVNNGQLEPEKDLFESDFTSTETRRTFRNLQELPYIPLFRQKDEDGVISYSLYGNGKAYLENEFVFYASNYWKALADNTGVYPGTDGNIWARYQESELFERLDVSPRLLVLNDRGSSGAMPVGESRDPFTVHYFQFEATGIPSVLLQYNYFRVAQQMLTRSRILGLNLRLTATDVQGLDFMRPVRLNIPERDNLTGLFCLNKIETYQPGTVLSTPVELIRVNSAALSAAGHQEYSSEYSEEYN